MANIKKRTVSISTILSATAFRDGYEAAAKGIPFDPDAYKGERPITDFPRRTCTRMVRYFAAHCKAELGRCIPLKYGRIVSRDAIREYHNARLSGSV
jgi:hypothetical protein